ncbi:MAG: tetratricopeptide repeat protein [Limnobacter sp.]|nr:tetratricopeptide repeat protein [Limnobacter sp.]
MSRYSLEEEEQINKLKAFWASYGNFILTVLIIVFGTFAANNGYKWYQARQSNQSVLAYEKTERASQEGNIELLKKVQGTLLNEHSGSPYAQRGAVLAAQAFYDAGEIEEAKTSLNWVIEHGDLNEYVSSARLTLSGLLIDEEKYEEATALLKDKAGEGFEGLFLDRQGDIMALSGKPDQARSLYEASLEKLQSDSPWRSVVERKIAALPAGK